MTITESICRVIIATASLLAPRDQRADWREEWDAEVWHRLHGADGAAMRGHRGAVRDASLVPSHENELPPDSSGNRRVAGSLRLVLRCLGAFAHATSLRADALQELRMNGLAQEIKLALRTFVKRPGFTLVAVLTLGLGIGGSTAVFSVINGVLLRPLPIENVDRLVYVWGRSFPTGPGASVSAPDYVEYRAGTGDVFEEFAAYSSFARTVVLEGGDRPEELRSRAVTANLLSALGYEPAAGRSFSAEETAGDRPSVVMISYGLWGRLFGFERNAIGSTLRLEGEPVTIVGVLPADLDFPADLDLWFPATFAADGWDSRGAHFLRPIGLLRTGNSLEHAQAAIDVVSSRLEAAYPDTNDEWYAVLQPLQEVMVGQARPALLVLLAAVGLVLLIACANVANLLLTRASTRSGEIAVRTALGASRARLIRQVLTESLLLAGAAGAAGIALAYVGVEALRSFEPGNLPRLAEVRVDALALAFTASISLAIGLLFGAVPAFASHGGRLQPLLRSAERGRPRSGRFLRGGLVVGEVALCFVLLIGAGLLMRSFMQLRTVDPGFDVERAIAFPVSFPERLYPSLDGVDVARDAIIERLAGLPGATDVGAITVVPLSGSGEDTYVFAEGRQPAEIFDVNNTAQLRHVDESYFATMRIPLVAGRAFDRRDNRGAPPRVIINQTLADSLFPGEDPIGRRLVAWLGDLEPLEIIGVAADIRQFALNFPPSPAFYVSARQRGTRGLNIVVRFSGDSWPGVTTLRQAVWEVDPRQPVSAVTPLDSYVSANLSGGRFQVLLLLTFAILALALAAIGIYGVLAHTVGERRHEIGIRIAMGAESTTVARMVVGQGMRLALIGLVLGLGGALAASAALRSLLFGVGSVDPLTYVLTPAFLLTVVFLSSWLPARRAARTDPATVLRQEA